MPSLLRAGPELSADVRAADYRTLNAVHSVLLAGVAVAAHRRGDERTRLTTTEWAQISVATFALSKAVTREKIGTWVREPFVEETPDGHRPRGRRLRAAIGELVTCPRCLGTWTSLGLVGLRLASPPAARMVTGVFAAAGANDALQAGFRLLCERTNLTQAEAREADRA